MNQQTKKYYSNLSEYFLSKPLWFDEENKGKPNIRKLAEQPWQQTIGGKWSSLELCLTSVEFLDCKCEFIGINEILHDLKNALHFIPITEPQRKEILFTFTIFDGLSHILRIEHKILPQLLFNELAWCHHKSKLWKSVINVLIKPRNKFLLLVREVVGAIDSKPLRTIGSPNRKNSKIAISPDGKIIAGACEELGICLWDAETGILQKVLSIKDNHDLCVAFNSDGSRLASAGWWSSVWIWDLKSSKLLQEVKIWSFVVDLFYNQITNSFVFADDKGNVIMIDDSKNPELQIVYEPPPILPSSDLPEYLIPSYYALMDSKRISHIEMTSDGAFIAAGSENGGIGLADRTGNMRGWIYEPKVNDVEIKDMPPSYQLVWEGITKLAFSPNSNYLVSTHRSWRWRLWNINNSTPLFERKGHRASIISLTFHPDSKQFVTGGEDGEIHFWSVESGKKLGSIIGHYGFLISLTFSPDGKLLYSACDDGTIKVWEVSSAILKPQLRTLGHNKIIDGASFSFNCNFLASWQKYSVIIWNVEEMQPIKKLEYNGFVLSIKFSNDEKLCAISTKGNSLYVYSTDTWEINLKINNNSGDLSCISFSPDNNCLAAGDDCGIVCVWNAKTGQREKLFKPLESTGMTFMGITSLAYSSDSLYLYVTSVSPDLFICSIDKIAIRQVTPKSHAGSREYIYLMNQNNKVLTTNASSTIEIIDILNGAVVSTIKGPVNQHTIKGLAVSTKGRYVATIYGSNIIEIWNTITGERDCVFHSKHKALAIHFDPDSDHLFVADLGGSLHIPNVYELSIAESTKKPNATD